MTNTKPFTPVTRWGGWGLDLAQQSDKELGERDVAELSLRCAMDLPGTDNSLLDACLQKVDDLAILVDRYTQHLYHHFWNDPVGFQNSESRFRVIALAQCLHQHVRIAYNFSFLDGDYDASDSRNLFIHGILTGAGGTCTSMPVLFCAIGRRLGYPLNLAEASEHFFCRWDDDREHFCFDATSRGATIRDAEYYRHWPKPITPDVERNNGLLRSLTRREELAAFAAARGNCLFDNFHFETALESYSLAHTIAPHKLQLRNTWRLAVLSFALWQSFHRLCKQFVDIPLVQAIRLAALDLCGADADLLSELAVQNVLRIVRNRNRRDRLADQEAAVEQLANSR